MFGGIHICKQRGLRVLKGLNSRIGRKISPKLLLESGFEYIEDNFPNAASFFNYFSRGKLLDDKDFCEIIERDHRLLEPAYRSQFTKLTEIIPHFDIDRHSQIRVPIKSGFIENAIIHGHIKAPIRSSDQLAFGFAFPKLQRLPWGDVYPLPLKRTFRVRGDVIFVPHLINIFHLLIEHVLPPFSFVIRNRHSNSCSRKITFVSQVNFPLLKLLTDFLRFSGFDASVIYIKPYDKVLADRIIVSRAVSDDGDLNYAFAEEMEELESFISNITADINVPDVCYIKRTNTPRRNILNQKQFISELSKIGIKSYDFNFENVLIQMAVFSKAKIIISGNGAALTNMIWANRPIDIIELFSKERRPKAMLNIAAHHGLGYHPLIGSSESGNGHYSFDIDETIDYVKKIMK